MAQPNQKIIYALFDSPKAVECALQGLDTVGVTLDDISILMTEDTHDEDFAGLELTKTAEGAATGSVVGGFVGSVLGGLVAIGSAMTGGIGLMVMGPAIALAAAGGLVGGLIGHGIPEAEAKRLHDEIAAGKVMFAVHVNTDERVEDVQRILDDSKAEIVQMPTSHVTESLSV